MKEIIFGAFPAKGKPIGGVVILGALPIMGE